jgi:hypothetical protein
VRKWIVLLLLFTVAESVQAERTNIKGGQQYVLFTDEVLTATVDVTSSGNAPVGNCEDAQMEVKVTGLNPTDSLTITTLGISSTAVKNGVTMNTVGYHVPVGIASQRVILGSDPNPSMWPIIFPNGLESLKLRIQSSRTGAKVSIVVGTQ